MLARLGAALALAIPLAAGCHLLPGTQKTTNPPIPPDRTPDAPALVNYLNSNAQKVQTVRAKVAIDVKQARQAVGLDGFVACQKPRDFRLRAMVLGKVEADLGSNEEKFWYWVGKASPRVFYCSYRDLSTGKVEVPFPFQPDMVLAALNMADYDPKGRYDLKVQAKTVELTQETTSPNGKPVKRTTVFDRYVAAAGKPQVLAHILKDSSGKLICKANVESVLVDRGSGAIIPTRVTIEWPAQQVSMKLMLSDLQVNTIDKKTAGQLFQPTALESYDFFNLARGVVDTPASLRRASTAPTTR
jgi:hypothetical protein